MSPQAPPHRGTPGDPFAHVDPHDYYRARTEGTLAERLFHPRRAAALDALLPPGGRILDVGSSTGALAIPWTRGGREVLAVELGEAHLGQLARHAVRVGVKVPAVQADAGALPFADGSFEIVVLASVVHLLPEPGPALREAARVTAVGGTLLIGTPWRWHPKSSRRIKRALRGGAEVRPTWPVDERTVARHLDGWRMTARRLDPVFGYVAMAFRRG